jgi:hypothetical protein
MKRIPISTSGTATINDLIRLDDRLHIEIQALTVRLNESTDPYHEHGLAIKATAYLKARQWLAELMTETSIQNELVIPRAIECGCGKHFQTRRGLAIHTGRIHRHMLWHQARAEEVREQEGE